MLPPIPSAALLKVIARLRTIIFLSGIFSLVLIQHEHLVPLDAAR
jgi:hypothetical protein